ncbi:MAG: TraB/GumN family protein [Spirochaetia bacterium]|nr:TraB/GumN family protein [Spirochaetia bacterium]
MEILERSDTLTRVLVDGRQIILVGTAHVSKESVEEVCSRIESEQPKRVCVELDERRFRSLKEGAKWENLNIFKVLKTGQGFFLLANLAMSAFQKRIGASLDTKPGMEMAGAIEKAESAGIPVSLVDRDIQVTLKRAWKLSSGGEKIKMMNTLVGSIFSTEEVSAEEIEELKKKGAMEDLMQEMAENLPSAKTAIIDERDRYLATKIYECTEEKVLAVLGAGHVPGILRYFEAFERAGKTESLDSISVVPPKSTAGKVLPWLVPALFAAIVITGFFRAGWDRSVSMLVSWILVNGSLAALGALIAMAHPLTILVSFVAAPITSLNPTIGVGMFSGIVEAAMRKPRVKDCENLADDIMSVKGFFRNRITHILLVFFFASLGSVIGTIIVFPYLLALLK